MSCTRVTKKSYASRPSPPYHASACQNQVMAGNDGSLYKSTADKRGVYTWKKADTNHRNAPGRKTKKAKGAKRYQIHDNGGRPFTVEDIPSTKTAVLYANSVDENDTSIVKSLKELMRMKYHWICFGDPKSKELGEYEKGSTVLIQKNKTDYYYIGQYIMQFSLAPGDDVETFLNPIGPNDVPYASIIGTKNVYFLIEQLMLPVSMIDPNSCPYDQLYGMNDFKGKPLRKKATKMKFKILHDAVY
jgi:hypothetical protein